MGKRAVRIRRVKEPLLLTFCSATDAAAAESKEAESQNTDGNSDGSQLLIGKTKAKLELGPNMRLDSELYEGIVSQTIIEPTVSVTATSTSRICLIARSNDQGCFQRIFKIQIDHCITGHTQLT